MARDETIKLSLVDGVTKSLGQIRDGVSGVGAQLAKLNQVADLAGKAFGLVGSAVSAIGSNVQGVADLESTLAVIQERTQATAAEMGLLQQAISAATRDGKASIEDAAAALAELTKEGLSATQSAQALGPVLAFAASNATSASQAVGSLLDILGGFNAPADGIASLADKLTALSRATGAPVEALQNGLAGISVQADAANLSLDQSLVLIGALANRSIEGGRASAALNKALAELTDPASKAGEALKEVGGNTADVMQALRLLAADAGKAEAVLSQFGAKPRLALQALLADGGAALDGLQQKLDEATGSSQAASDAIGDTFNRAVVALQNSVANLRNEFLSPILQPLADEAVALAEKLNALGDSPQFARIRDQFQELATNAIRSVGDLIEQADLEAWAGDVADFAEDAKLTFDALVLVVKTTAGAIRDIGAAIDFVRDAQKKLHDLLGENSRPVDAFIARQKALREQSKLVGDAFGAASEKALRLAEAVGFVGKEASSAAGDVAGLGTDAKDAADDLRQIPEAAKLTVGTLDQTGSAAEQAAERIGVLQLQIAKLAQAQAALWQSGASSGAEFQRLTAEIQRLEEELQRLKGGTDNNKGSQQQLGDQADRTSQSVQRFAQSLRDSSDAGRESVRTNSQVADSFGNIGNKSSETAISLGNLSEAFVRQALEAAGAAKSAKDYIDTLNRYFAAGADQEEKIKARLDQLSRQNAALSEEEQIRKRLALQYGTSSTLLDELVRKELELARAKKQANDETERGIQIEAQRTAGFGGVGTGQQAEATGGATGGRGSGGGGDRGAPQIVINVQGMTTDQARQFVEQSVVPELERINRLSR